MRRSTLALAMSLLVLEAVTVCALPVTRARAQDAYSCIDELRDDEVSHRLAYIVRQLDGGKTRARLWWYAWLGVGVSAMAFSWTFFGMKAGQDREVRDPLFINAFGGTLLTAQTLALPFYAAIAPGRLARMPESTPEERRQKLRRATHLLERSAARARGLSRWPSHLGSAVYALTGGSYLAARYDAPLATTQAFLAPMLIAELRVWTIPFDAVRAFEAYRGFACAPALPDAAPALDEGAPMAPPPAPSVTVVPAPLGLGLRVTF
jgi:hypothetical protein